MCYSVESLREGEEEREGAWEGGSACASEIRGRDWEIGGGRSLFRIELARGRGGSNRFHYNIKMHVSFTESSTGQ